MNNNDYILCRWRDASSDPPAPGWIGLNTMANGSRYYGACGYMPGDQWLDITAISAVPLAAVQEAVDEMNRIAYMVGSNCEFLRGMELKRCQDLDFMKQFTGVTPTEVPHA